MGGGRNIKTSTKFSSCCQRIISLNVSLTCHYVCGQIKLLHSFPFHTHTHKSGDWNFVIISIPPLYHNALIIHGTTQFSFKQTTTPLPSNTRRILILHRNIKHIWFKTENWALIKICIIELNKNKRAFMFPFFTGTLYFASLASGHLQLTYRKSLAIMAKKC